MESGFRITVRQPCLGTPAEQTLQLLLNWSVFSGPGPEKPEGFTSLVTEIVVVSIK